MNRLIYLFAATILYLALILAPSVATITQITSHPAAEFNPVWSPDGTRIAFERTAGFSHRLFLMDATGSNQRELDGKSGLLPTWSPDGSEVAYIAYEFDPAASQFESLAVHLVAADGSNDRMILPLSSFPAHLRWTPDGSRIIVEDAEALHTVRPDGSDHTVVPEPEVGYARIWSPDGSRIATMQRENDTESAIWVMNSDGSGAQKLLVHPSQAYFLAWSPDGEQIAFQHLVESNGSWTYHTFLVHRDGSGAVEIATGSGVDGYDLDWSPDSSRVAFGSGGDIYMSNVDGSGSTQLTAGEDFDMAPAWSPSGEKIVFQRSHTYAILDMDIAIYSYELYTVDASENVGGEASGDGEIATLTRLTDNRMNEGAPAWSPDGSTLLFNSNLDAYSELHMVAAGGGDAVKLSEGLAVSSYGWSPDGSTLAMAAGRTVADYELYLVEPESQLSTQTLAKVPMDRAVLNVAWSPDGNYLALTTFAFPAFQDYKLRVLDVRDDNIEKLPAVAAKPEGPPAWSPDSTKIAFLRQNGSSHDLYIVGVEGEDERLLTRLPYAFSQPLWSPDGAKLALLAAGQEYRAYLYVVDANSGTAKLVEIGAGAVESFAWSPDSSRLVTGAYDSHPLPTAFTVALVNSDGSGYQPLATYAFEVGHSPFGGWRAEWSPDGKWLAYRSGFGMMTLSKADGSRHYDIPHPLTYTITPRWSPDGKAIAFSSSENGNTDIYVATLALPE